MQGGASIDYTELVLAVGSKYNKFGWPGQDLKGAQGLYRVRMAQGNTRCNIHYQRPGY